VAALIAGLPERELFASGHRACAGCGEALAIRTIMKAAGENTIVVSATGCMEVVSTPYPQTAWKTPWLHGAFENASAIASGVDKALEAKGVRDKMNLLVIGGDGASFDIGLQSLSGAMERGHNFLYVCTDNAAYMNTGVQRSGGTPKYAATTTSPSGKVIPGKTEWKKPLPFIMAAHKPRYVATASVANLVDLQRKIAKGLELKGPAFVQVFCPCPIGWHYDTSQTINVAKLAVESRVSPLYEIEDGALKITMDVPSPKPVEDYLKVQGRFKHLKPEHIKEIQEFVDKEWAKLKHLEKCGSIF
jgi:pyruvate ferredoxin oxidoreductase beta subunit